MKESFFDFSFCIKNCILNPLNILLKGFSICYSLSSLLIDGFDYLKFCLISISFLFSPF